MLPEKTLPADIACCVRKTLGSLEKMKVYLRHIYIYLTGELSVQHRSLKAKPLPRVESAQEYVGE